MHVLDNGVCVTCNPPVEKHEFVDGVCETCSDNEPLSENEHALLTALNELTSSAVTAAWDPAKHPRNPKGSPGGGRFRSMVDRLKDAIEAHGKGIGDGHPFDGFTREQLRRVAKARGIELKRGESRESIADKLLYHEGSPLHGLHKPKGSPESHLTAMYGDRLKVTAKGNHGERYIGDLEQIPDAMHHRMVKYFEGHPDGGVYIVDGSLTSTPGTASLKGVTPRGWEKSGRTWDDVPGGYVVNSRQVILGDEGAHSHGADSLARHEFAHGIDHALGEISGTQAWRDVSGYAVGAAGNPYFKHEYNPIGFWSEAFAESYSVWARAVANHEDAASAIANALGVPLFNRKIPEIRKSLQSIIKFFEGL